MHRKQCVANDLVDSKAGNVRDNVRNSDKHKGTLHETILIIRKRRVINLRKVNCYIHREILHYVAY